MSGLTNNSETESVGSQWKVGGRVILALLSTFNGQSVWISSCGCWRAMKLLNNINKRPKLLWCKCIFTCRNPSSSYTLLDSSNVPSRHLAVLLKIDTAEKLAFSEFSSKVVCFPLQDDSKRGIKTLSVSEFVNLSCSLLSNDRLILMWILALRIDIRRL